MLDIYKSMMIYDWHFPGEYYCGISRMAFVNVELINILTQQIPKETNGMKSAKKWVTPSKSPSKQPLALDATKQESWEAVFKRLSVQGFGDFYLKDKFLLLKTPFINDCEIWKGMLEGLLYVSSWRPEIRCRHWFLK